MKKHSMSKNMNLTKLIISKERNHVQHIPYTKNRQLVKLD